MLEDVDRFTNMKGILKVVSNFTHILSNSFTPLNDDPINLWYIVYSKLKPIPYYSVLTMDYDGLKLHLYS